MRVRLRLRLTLIIMITIGLLYVTTVPSTPHASVYDGQDSDYGQAAINSTTTTIKTNTKTETETTNNLEINDFDDFQEFLEENWLFIVFIILFVWILFSAMYKVKKRNN
ncbi:hypothetical protein LCGC14_0194470 [marine sediment metagenome]|uniref:Uncharacterized protein n=1 Tax=marine sediment metagenome TaxID=412755 RepID=A0A0F9UK34_9ZZZZ